MTTEPNASGRPLGARVRTMAAELVGAWAHTHPEAAAALLASARDDP